MKFVPMRGIVAPLERHINFESTAPATRNRLLIVKVEAMFFDVQM